MKKLISAIFIIAVLLNIAVFADPVCPANENIPQVTGEAAILMDADTGQILYELNAHKKLAPASLAKIMTVLLAIEFNNPNELVTISLEDTQLNSSEASGTDSLEVGERVPLIDLMYSSALESSNDSTKAIANFVGGGFDGFLEMMNSRAMEIGAVNTNFNSCTGLSDSNLYSTAYDLALITKEGLKHPDFVSLFGVKKYDAQTTNRNNTRSFSNPHQLIKDGSLQDTRVIAGKTSRTGDAGSVSVTVAQSGDRTLICVALKYDETYNMYTEAEKLITYGFDKFIKINLQNFSAERPIYDANNSQVGKMILSLPEYSYVLAHSHVTIDDITYTENLPPSFTQNNEANALVTANLPPISHVSSNASEIKLSKTEQIFVTMPSTPTEDGDNKTEDGGTTFGGVILSILKFLATLILLLFIFLAVVIMYLRYKNTQKRKRRRGIR